VIAGLLLAAGESTRMRQLKALLPWGRTTLLEYAAEQLAAAVDESIVVLGHRADELAPLVGRYVLNEHYREGRSTSIEAGMRVVPSDAAAVLVANVDQPRPAAVLSQLIEAHHRAGALISRPVVGDDHGHPTVFDRALFDELRQLSEESEGLKSVLRRHSGAIQNVPFDDPVVLLNLNRPEEYAAAAARFAPN
jgi:molybdenum cofactor cytidylyltransferase